MRRREPTRATSERLLSAAGGLRPGDREHDRLDPPDGAREIAALLASAVAPARPEELRGLEAALSSFREARERPVRRPARVSLRGTPLRFATAAAVLTATGFVLVAGIAPAAYESRTPPGTAGPAPTALPSTGLPSPSPTTTSDHPPQPEKSPESPDAPRSPEHTSDPATLRRLCRAFGENPGHTRRDPDFPLLVAAAGGNGEVRAYCADLIGDDDPGRDDGNDGQDPGGHGDDPNGDDPPAGPNPEDPADAAPDPPADPAEATDPAEAADPAEPPAPVPSADPDLGDLSARLPRASLGTS